MSEDKITAPVPPADRSPKAAFWARLWWLAERYVNRAVGEWRVRKVVKAPLSRITRTPRASGVIVSLTTHGARFETVHLTVLTILHGRIRPQKVMLWVDDVALFESPTPELVALFDLGLQLELTENLGPHTKYYPSLTDVIETGGILVTADDDILYPRSWLQDLLRSSSRAPSDVHAYRCHRIRFDNRGAIAPYSTWTPSFGTEPKHARFFTGVSGVVYPHSVVTNLRSRGRTFQDLAPRADDVWLNFVAMQSEAAIRQVSWLPRHFPIIRGSQAISLVRDNVAGSGNDAQIAAVFGPTLRRRMRDGA